MPHLTRRAALLIPAFVPALLATRPAAAAPDLPGTYALPDGEAKVSARLAILPPKPPPRGLRLDIEMTRLGTDTPIRRYDVELSKRLHVIAVSEDFTTFLHEHAASPRPDDFHFHVPMRFPHGGRWHIFADAVPTGLGQQVMRFAATIDGPPAPPRPPLAPALQGTDGRYAARFDALDLRAGQPAQLTLTLLRDGAPAPDITPYLGVPAHAVFIADSTLTYVHAHAQAATTPGMDHTAMPGMDHAAMPAMNHTAHAPMPPASTKITPTLALHVRPPAPGTYHLWIQFQAGGKVRTIPFTLSVA